MPRQVDKSSKRAPKVALSHLDESDLSDESVSDYQASSNSEDERCSTPESQKDSRCGVCSRTVNSSDKSLQCDTCSEWCHIKVGHLLIGHLLGGKTSLQNMIWNHICGPWSHAKPNRCRWT